MIRVSMTVLMCCLLMPDEVAAAPRELYGKSVVVTWSESRMQRNVGEANFRPVQASHEFKLYIGREGRVFNRLTNSTRRGTASVDQIAGEAGATRVPAFKGRSVTVFMPARKGSNMWRLSIDFDAGFSSCSAKVIRAREAGSTYMVGTSPITGARIETLSVQVSGEACTVRNSNVFAGE
jgi:hypothetical protein